jgi:hypothetical protein
VDGASHSCERSLAILNMVHKLSLYGVKVLSYQESWTEAPGEVGEILYAIAGWVTRMESRGDQSELKRNWQDSRHPARCLVGHLVVPIKRGDKKGYLGFMLNILRLKAVFNKGTFLTNPVKFHFTIVKRRLP